MAQINCLRQHTKQANEILLFYIFLYISLAHAAAHKNGKLSKHLLHR